MFANSKRHIVFKAGLWFGLLIIIGRKNTTTKTMPATIKIRFRDFMVSNCQRRVPIFPHRFVTELADQFRADPGGMSVKKDF